jgi:hypothetical protein
MKNWIKVFLLIKARVTGDGKTTAQPTAAPAPLPMPGPAAG